MKYPLTATLLFALGLPACKPSTQDTAAPAAPPSHPAPPPPAPSPAPGPALPADPGNLESLTQNYFSWLQEGNWDAIAGIFHPESLDEFRSLVDFLETADRNPAAAQMRAHFFGPDATAATVAALADATLFSRVMSAHTQRPDAAATLNARTLDVLGWVPEGETIMHVVTRSNTPASGDVYDVMEVVSYKKHGDAWKVLMTGRMKNNIRSLRARIEDPAASAPPAPPQR